MGDQASSVRVRLDALELNMRLGVHPWERHDERKSRLVASVELELPLAAYYAQAGGYLDYDPVYAFLKAWETRPHTDHLETLAEDLLDFLFARTPATRAQVRLTKPDIFADAAGVGVSYDVNRQDWMTLRG